MYETIYINSVCFENVRNFFNWAYSRMMDYYPSPSYLHGEHCWLARCKF